MTIKYNRDWILKFTEIHERDCKAIMQSLQEQVVVTREDKTIQSEQTRHTIIRGLERDIQQNIGYQKCLKQLAFIVGTDSAT